MLKIFIFSISIILLSVSIPTQSYANSMQLAAGPISKRQAANIALQHRPGRVLNVIYINKVPAYRVKILTTGGDVTAVLIHARTGKLIRK